MATSLSNPINAPHFAVINNRFQQIPCQITREEIERQESVKEEEQKVHQEQIIAEDLKARKVFHREKDVRSFLDLKTFQAASKFFSETMITISQEARANLNEFLKINSEFLGDDYEIDRIAQAELVEIITEKNCAVKRLASGAEGRVFEATVVGDEKAPKSVYKVLKNSKDYTADSPEVKMARKIKSRAILPVSCIKETNSSYELEFCFEVYRALCLERGTSLESVFSDETKSLGAKLTVLLQVAETLSILHNHSRFSHHDLKPDNIIIRENGHIAFIDPSKVCKFGELRKLNVGTMIYSSPPEVLKNEMYYVSHAVDIWSIGMMLYKIITGRLPFMGMEELAIAFAIMRGNYKDKIFCDDIEGKWKEIIVILESVASNMYILDDSEEPVNEKGPSFIDLPLDELKKLIEKSVNDVFSDVLDDLIGVETLKGHPHFEVESEKFKKNKEAIILTIDKSFDQITIEDLELFHNFLNLKFNLITGECSGECELILQKIKMIICEMKLRQYPELRALCIKLLDENPAMRGTSEDFILALDQFLVNHAKILEV